jgi:flap endonuclease-1
MGVRLLNRFLKTNISKLGIKKIHLNELRGKKIAVDTSIYLNKFKQDNALFDNMYLMISLFRYYNIIPIYVFDGKPPPEKNRTLEERAAVKRIAKDQYESLKSEYDQCNDIDIDKIQELEKKMEVERKKFVRITRNDIEEVKHLMDVYGINYIQADGEADIVCVSLVKQKVAHACLSEDMDLFVYGCSKVIKYFSLINHTIVLYDLTIILDELNLSQNEFRKICILVGNDYYEPCYNIFKVMSLFQKFKKSKNISIGFYEWLKKKNKELDLQELNRIYSMFVLISKLNFKNNYINKKYCKLELRKLLKEKNYIYLY